MYGVEVTAKLGSGKDWVLSYNKGDLVICTAKINIPRP